MAAKWLKRQQADSGRWKSAAANAFVLGIGKIRALARSAAFVDAKGARHLLLVLGAILSLALGVDTTLALIHMRDQDIAEAQDQLRKLALLLATDIDRVFYDAELMQLELIDDLRDRGIDTPEQFAQQVGTQEINRYLKLRSDRLAGISSISLISLDGQMLNVSRSWPTPAMNISDRDFYKTLHSDPALTSVISEPLQAKSDGSWTIYLARKVKSREGLVLGYINVGIRLEPIETAFSQVLDSYNGSFLLARLDGLRLTRYPPHRVKTGAMVGKQNFDSMLAGMNQTVQLVSDVDGKRRLVAPRRLVHFPALVRSPPIWR
jgi:hypothetical protein